MQSNTVLTGFLGLLITCQSLRADEPACPQPANDSGSDLTYKEAGALVAYHNELRREVGVSPVKWSPTLAKFAQGWANEVAKTGKLRHRPRDATSKNQYGENMAWGAGADFDALKGAEYWGQEAKFYLPGTSIPADFASFKALHYTQMVWRDSTEIGAGKATVQAGPMKGWTVIVCNYNPVGNLVGRKPY